jgi:hypothetical protein
MTARAQAGGDVTDKQKQKTVIVIGTARSGTSVTGGMLSSLGVDMGNVGYPTKSNPRGAFEDRDFERFHKEMFNAIDGGKTYWDPPTRERVLEEKPAVDARIARLIAEKAKGQSLWGWKHPRQVLTIDLFLPYVENPHFVMVFRNPLEIAYSSVEHTKNRARSVDLITGLKLANFYQKEMVDFLDRYPQFPAILVTFDDIVRQPMKEAARLAEFLDIDLDEKKRKAVEHMVIPREQIEASRKVATGLWTGRLPKLVKKTVASALGRRKRVDV